MATTGKEILSIAAAVDKLSKQHGGRIQQLTIDSTLELSTKDQRSLLIKLLRKLEINHLTLIHFPNCRCKNFFVSNVHAYDNKFAHLLKRLNTVHLTLWDSYLDGYYSGLASLSPVVKQLTVHNTKVPYRMYLMRFLDRALADSPHEIEFQITGSGTTKEQLKFLQKAIQLRKDFREGYVGLEKSSETAVQNGSRVCP